MPGSPTVPDWVEVRTGTAPLLLLAPHGGRRAGSHHPARRKVNDLHTADLTRELASAWNATCVINAHRDRNDLDLNRIDQVRGRAPWLLHWLADTLEAMVARAGRATLLTIHGWNVIQTACDVGIGLRERNGRLVGAERGHCTVTGDFLEHVLRPLQRLAADAQVAVTIGARYPAADPNNLLQLLTPARAAEADPSLRRLGTLACTGRMDAAQLELGIPLRWPGRYRTLFTVLLAQALGATTRYPPAQPPPPRSNPTPASGAPRPCHPPPAPLIAGGRVTRRRTLQFAAGNVLGLCALDGSPTGGISGRLLLSAAPGRLTLFTGELATRGGTVWRVPALEYADGAEGTVILRFRGPMLAFRTLQAFLDLEQGLASATLADVAVDLLVAPALPPHCGAQDACRFAPLAGSVTLADGRRVIDALALLTDGPPQPSLACPALHLALPATPLGPLALASETGPRGTIETAPRGDRTSRTRELRFALRERCQAGGPHEPVRGHCVLTLGSAGGTLSLTATAASRGTFTATGAIERVIPVRRPHPRGTILQTTYALCRLTGLAPGWLELAVEKPGSPRRASSGSAARDGL